MAGPAKKGKGRGGAGAAADEAAPCGPDGDPYTFEQALARLETIVEELENGKLPLEASLACFEEGVTLTRFLESELTKAQKRVEELVESAGEVSTRPWAGDDEFEDEAEDLAEEEDEEAEEDEDDDAL